MMLNKVLEKIDIQKPSEALLAAEGFFVSFVDQIWISRL